MAKKLPIAEVKAVVPTPDGSAVVVKAEALAADERTEVEIAITTDLAARTAITLLATTAKARALRDGLEPAPWADPDDCVRRRCLQDRQRFGDERAGAGRARQLSGDLYG